MTESAGTKIAGRAVDVSDLRARAERVLAGKQTGAYTKRQMARDMLALCDVVEARR